MHPLISPLIKMTLITENRKFFISVYVLTVLIFVVRLLWDLICWKLFHHTLYINCLSFYYFSVLVLAVSYSCGKINLYDIENTEVLHTIELQGEITSLTWINQVISENNVWTPEPYQEDDFNQFLPKLLPLSKRLVIVQYFLDYLVYMNNWFNTCHFNRRIMKKTSLQHKYSGLSVWPCG